METSEIPNTTQKLKPAFGYLRVSSIGQIEKDGFPRQKATIKTWAAANGFRIAKWFQEEGVSGTTDGVDRPAFQEMMIALMSNGTTTVLIEKLDRLARDILVQETIVQDMQKRGFELISVMEPDLCKDDPSRELMRVIFGAFAQYDRKMVILKTRAARVRIRRSGKKCEGRKSYGFREGESVVVDRMKTFQAEHKNYEQIASTLNAEGIKTRSGGKWFPATVRKIVKR